jgi:heat shock protein HslJ
MKNAALPLAVRGLLGAALALALVGCAGWIPQSAPARTPAPAPAMVPAPVPSVVVSDAALEGSAWSALYVHEVGHTVEPRPYLQWASPPQIVGSGGCNRFAGQAHIFAQEQLRFSALASTRMACIPEPGGQEDRFFKALELTSQVRLEGDDLLLLDQAGKTLVQLRRMGTVP